MLFKVFRQIYHPHFIFLQDDFEAELISFDSFVIPYTETYDRDNQYHPLLCHTASVLICLLKPSCQMRQEFCTN